MKKFFNYAIAITVLFMGIACSKKIANPDDLIFSNDNQEQVAPITITATLSDALTRVSFTPDVNTAGKPMMKLAWEADDKLRVADHADHGSYSDFELNAGCVGQKDGVFTGTPVEAESYDVWVIHGDVSNMQVQDSDEDASHIEYIAQKNEVSLADLPSITFTDVSSVLGIQAKLPAGAAQNITSVVLTASENIFFGGTTLTIGIFTPGDTKDDGILNLYVTLPAGDQAIPTGTTLFVQFNAPNTSHTVYTAYREFASGISFASGALNNIKINCVNTDKYAGKDDKGTADAPYLIADKYQMDAVHQLMQRGEMKYFKLIDNLDMTNIVWFPLNNGFADPSATKYTGNTYDKAIDFDGNGKTIKNLSTKNDDLTDSYVYASLFGVLMGNVYDLTIDNATVTPKGKSGILAGYVGTGSYGPNHCEVRNVTIKNSKIENGGDYCGALAGQSAKNGNVFSNISISDCVVSTSGYAAGLVAYFANSATVNDITVSGANVTSSGHSTSSTIPTDGIAGGIAARVNAVVDFDRCTYQNGEVTGPTQADNDNSKLNRYVGGLSGRVENRAVTFDDCHVKNVTIGLVSNPATNNFRYVGGAFGYIGGAVVVGNTTGCTVEDITTTESVRNYVAGFVSYLDGGTIKNSSASSSTAIGVTEKSGAVGGFVGYCVGGKLYNNTASVPVKGAGNPGGFVGWNETTATTFEKCSASGAVNASANNAGGFAGIVKIGSTFSECYSTGTVESSAGYVGGFAGNINADNVTLTKCYSTSTVTASGNYVGGLVGVSESDTIEKCYYDGTVTGNSRVGGILGISLKDDAVTIRDCYSRGKVVGSATEQRFGGIVADLGKGGQVINCWSDATVNAGRVCGGIVGLACYQTWADNTVANNMVTGCIAWNPEVKAAQSGNYGSSGAIIGHTSFKNQFGNGYRRPDIDYKNSYNCSGGEWNTVMVDQPDCDGTNWAKGTTPGTNASYTYQQPYYGVAAAAGAKVSSIAQTLGWSGDVWDFSGDLPVLK